MITVDKKDNLTLKISHIVKESKARKLEVFLFIPGELGLTKDLISEGDFFYNSIYCKRTYYSNTNYLPLVLSRLAQRGSLSTEQYRLSLSLYAYQYAIGLEKSVQMLNDKAREEVTLQDAEEIIELALAILRKLRRTIPDDKKLKRYYANIDNYLSWYTEQQFLSLIAHIPKNDEYSAIKKRLIHICNTESQHRLDHSYNSKKAREDITRMSNKMRLLRRLIEYPIVLNEKGIELGRNMRRVVKGSATAFVMLFVSLMIIQARGFLGEITASFIFVISFIYAVREVFKDDLREALWRWIRKGKPKWRKGYFDPTTHTYVGRKLEWLDYLKFSELDDGIQKLRKHRVTQREETVIRYKSETEMSTTKFLTGYEQTRETVFFHLRTIANLVDKSTQKIYQLNEGQVIKDSVEKRHLINLLIREERSDMKTKLHRWKVTINRSKIIDIEKINIEDGLNSRDKK